ncbi:MIP/aquaporin family protein [Priestia aryabhattai]|uniref:Aquaporin family protein n=1 Tax=Priestia aryabhattai TaxID=412384 RepID=A0ABD7WXC3_PRIAR|nr:MULTISPECIES: MIP/aquaporin family protein [Priestia]MBY0030659.1 aquaporin family protein [Priestia aryabhattai]PVE65936.1 aquaporin [Priestia megaterium]PVE80110.1 aquaporin [Priestia megaterium]PVE85278.1 aquaporin [Priestia megaterium]PVE99379.1 aquaporin [Priestia megaterium]
MQAFLGEIIGTMILIILGAGVCAGVNLKKSFAANSGWIVITMGWGMAVAMAAYAVGNMSGAHLNPALTVALAITGDFPWSQVPMYILAQFIGAILGATVVYLHYLPHWKETKDAGTKLGVFATGPAIANPFANVLSEAIGTFVLVVGILAIGANKFTDGLNPLVVGFLIVSIGLSLGGTTGYAINPARDLGPRIAHAILPIPGKGSSNWKYAWVPVVGPLVGGSIGAVFYQAAFLNKMSSSLWIVLSIAVIVLAVIYAVSKQKAAQIQSAVVPKK